MTTVLAQGTFDILHPGHVHYLEESRRRGDELVVIVARGDNVDHKADPLLSDKQRRQMVESLEPVDRAILGHPTDIFVPLEEIDPDVVTLGHDQYHDEEKLRSALDRRGFDCVVCRLSGVQTGDDIVTSTSSIIEIAVEQRSAVPSSKMTAPPARRQYI